MHVKPQSHREITAYSNDFFLARVDDSDRLVFAGGTDEAAIAIPAHAVNDIRVHVQRYHGLTCASVPDDDQIVTT